MNKLNKQASARAHLLGLATTQLLCCRTKEALGHLLDFVEEYKDARDEIPTDFVQDIIAGNIRLDTAWSQGIDPELISITYDATAKNGRCPAAKRRLVQGSKPRWDLDSAVGRRCSAGSDQRNH